MGACSFREERRRPGYAAVRRAEEDSADGRKRVDDAETPEHINEGPNTHPSARLEVLHDPRYKKTLHGNRIAASIGLAHVRQECRHFDAWLTKLETLAPL